MKLSYRGWLKRVLDLLIGGLMLLLSLPLLAGIWVLVRAKLGSPVLFRQLRPGHLGVPFVLLKFRTMTNECTANGELQPEECRLTKFGEFLRRCSLDELPELVNVIKGEMSLVGPRPLLMEYLHRYTPEQARRHCVRPGITGWAQINGRNAITWTEKFRYDIWYVDHYSLFVDLRILIVTLQKVIWREDISAASCATMPTFRGDD